MYKTKIRMDKHEVNDNSVKSKQLNTFMNIMKKRYTYRPKSNSNGKTVLVIVYIICLTTRLTFNSTYI